MEQSVGKSSFSLPKWDAKKLSGTAITLIILGALGFVAYVYLLPFLLSVVWGTVQLAIGVVVGSFLLMTLLNPKFWRAMRYLSEAIAQYSLGWVIELNPFNILYLQVEQAEKDREDLHEQTIKLKGQQAKLSTSLVEKNRTLQISNEEIRILKDKLRKDPNNDDFQLQLETSTTKFTGAKEFIDKVKPIANDIDKLVDFGEKAYKKSGNALENAKMRITLQKETYEAVTTGASAMSKAMKAFTGHTDLNNDADRALEILRNDVANKIGTIKDAIQITSEIMNKQDLSDAAKVSLAAQTADQLNIDNKFDYTATVTGSASGMENVKVSSGNKFINFLDDKK